MPLSIITVAKLLPVTTLAFAAILCVMALWIRPSLRCEASAASPPASVETRPPELQRLFRLGEKVDGIALDIDGYLSLGPLNDQGQFCFVADAAAGGKLLLQYDSGKLVKIAAAGEQGPAGLWPSNLWFHFPLAMNGRGDVAFSGLLMKAGDGAAGATFLWDAETKELNSLAQPGIPSVENQSFQWAAGASPVIDDRGTVIFVANVKDSAGRGYPGLFERGVDGRLISRVRPGQTIADGGILTYSYLPSHRLMGQIAFLGRRQGTELETPFLWQSGTVIPLPQPTAPRGRFIIGYSGVWLNDFNRTALLSAQIHSLSGHADAPYLVLPGSILPVAEPGQSMPGGGKFATLLRFGVSVANNSGQHVLLAELEDRSTAAYLMQPDGKLSLLLKSGMTTSLGKLSRVGQGDEDSAGVGMNNRGEILLSVTIGNGPATVVLLTPRG